MVRYLIAKNKMLICKISGDPSSKITFYLSFPKFKDNKLKLTENMKIYILYILGDIDITSPL